MVSMTKIQETAADGVMMEITIDLVVDEEVGMTTTRKIMTASEKTERAKRSPNL